MEKIEVGDIVTGNDDGSMHKGVEWEVKAISGNVVHFRWLKSGPNSTMPIAEEDIAEEDIENDSIGIMYVRVLRKRHPDTGWVAHLRRKI